MENQEDSYKISFFKPTTELAKVNRNLTLKLLIVWVVAIFGFQILLKIVEKPTPEPAYTSFENVWESVKSGNSTVEEKQIAVKSFLSVLGKLMVKPDDREVLDNAVSYYTYQIVPNNSRSEFINLVNEFNSINNNEVSLTDKDYIVAKARIIDKASDILDVNKYSLKAKLLPFELNSRYMMELDIDNLLSVHTVMSKYLIHNQSFLTDFRFLGFPFHYFYTSVFLLILFVGLCWFYCYRIDIIHKRLNVNETV